VLSEESHKGSEENVVLNGKSGKLDCRKCMVQKGQSQDMIWIDHLQTTLPLDIKRTRRSLEAAQETLEFNIKSGKKNIYLKIM